MRRRKTHAVLIVTIILSVAYTIVALLNFLGPMHAPVVEIHGPVFHPLLCLLYLFVALAISWGFYFYTHKKNTLKSLVISIVIGVVLIFCGGFLWKAGDHYEDEVVTAAEISPMQTDN